MLTMFDVLQFAGTLAGAVVGWRVGAELVKRGELVESFRSVVEQQLASQSPDVQRFGRTNAQLRFPDLVSSQDVEETPCRSPESESGTS